MTYKVRHKGKHKEHWLVRGLGALGVQVVLIVAGLITAVVLPKAPEGARDMVSVVAGIVAGAGAALGGLTWLAQAVLGRHARGARVSAVMTLLYRATVVLIVAGLAAVFYRTMFR